MIIGEKSRVGNVLFLHGLVALLPKHVSTESRFLFITVACVRFNSAGINSSIFVIFYSFSFFSKHLKVNLKF